MLFIGLVFKKHVDLVDFATILTKKETKYKIKNFIIGVSPYFI
jgi:hypothetical protein